MSINQTNDQITIATIIAKQIPSEDEFKKKSFHEKWKEYTNLHYENHNLRMKLYDADTFKSLLISSNNNLSNNNNNLIAQISQLNKDNDILTIKNEALVAQLHDQKQLTQLIDALRSENTELKSKINALETDNIKLELKIAKQNEKINVLETDNIKLELKVAKQNEKILEQDNNIAVLKKGYDDLKNDIAILQQRDELRQVANK